MPLTPQQIQEARQQYGIKTTPASLDLSSNGATQAPAELSGNDLTSFLTDGTDGGTPTDTVTSRAIPAIKDALGNLQDSFTKRNKDIVDTTKKYVVDDIKPVSKQDVMDFYTGKQDTANPIASNLLAPFKNALNVVGQVAGASGDILAEAVKAGYKTLTPEQTQMKIADGVHNLIQTPLGQQGLVKIGEGADAYNAWKAQHPDGAKAIENVLNIGALFGGKTAEDAVAPLVTKATDLAGEGIDNLAKKTVASFDKLDEMAKSRTLQGLETKAYEAVTPNPDNFSGKEYEDLVKQGRITPKTITQPAQYILSDQEKETAKKYAYLLQNKDPVVNTTSVTNQIISRDDAVGTFLRKNNNIFNDGELKNALEKKHADINDITVNDEQLTKKKTMMVDNFIKSLDKNNMENLWQRRKAYDSEIDKAFSGSPTLQKQVKRALRDGVQNFIADRTPDGTYKAYMKDMSQLFDLQENTLRKASGEQGMSKIKAWAKEHPVKASAIGTIIGGGLVGSIYGAVH
jgi:hypothetical protein